MLARTDRSHSPVDLAARVEGQRQRPNAQSRVGIERGRQSRHGKMGADAHRDQCLLVLVQPAKGGAGLDLDRTTRNTGSISSIGSSEWPRIATDARKDAALRSQQHSQVITGAA